MAGRSLTDYQDRFLGAIVYLYALKDTMALGAIAAINLPYLSPILSPLFKVLNILLIPVNIIYGILAIAIPESFVSLIIFFILYAAVVQNPKISYFIRYNTMQSILIGIALSLVLIVLDTLSALAILGGILFLVVAPICIYCMAQCVLGNYPEIRSFSDFVYQQVRR